MRHPRHCITILVFPPISPTLHNLVCHPRHPRQNTAKPPTSPTLACKPRQHCTNANTSPTLAGLTSKHATYGTQASTKSMPYPKLLDIQLALKFQEKIQQFLLLVFIYIVFNFQAFLSNFIEVWKSAIEKLNFFEETSLPYSNAQFFFQKNLFPNISVASAILYILTLEKSLSENPQKCSL